LKSYKIKNFFEDTVDSKANGQITCVFQLLWPDNGCEFSICTMLGIIWKISPK